ncbi:MAG: hypothetical protein II293_03215 [Bacteroidaceae bacterium]|nr:hypothetical protein [Bacteroidaceae bacterium]
MLESGAVVWVHVHKGVTVRFGFDAVRTSQLQTNCQEQSNGNAPWDVYIQSVLAIDEMVNVFGVLYIHQRGAFSVARFDNLGQCEGLYSVERVTDWLHAFLYMYKSSS